jgi:AP2 domain
VRRHSDNKSGFKGVTLCPDTNRWAARIMVDGRSVFLGRYDSKEAAHSAYAASSKQLHGAFGRAA